MTVYRMIIYGSEGLFLSDSCGLMQDWYNL